jgi:hypothetical protein
MDTYSPSAQTRLDVGSASRDTILDLHLSVRESSHSSCARGAAFAKGGTPVERRDRAWDDANRVQYRLEIIRIYW